MKTFEMIVKKCTERDCENCRDYCVFFGDENDKKPYYDVVVTESLLEINLVCENKELPIYNKEKAIVDNKIAYYDEDFEEFRIFPDVSYKYLEIVYEELE